MPNIQITTKILACFTITLLSCSRLHNNFDEIRLACEANETELLDNHFIKMNTADRNSQWRGIAINQQGEGTALKNSTNGCILIPKDLKAENLQVFIRDELSSKYAALNLKSLDETKISFVEPTSISLSNQTPAIQLSCPSQRIFSNRAVYLKPEAVNAARFDVTLNIQRLTDSAGNELMFRKTLLPDASAQMIDLEGLTIRDDDYYLEVENQSAFEPQKQLISSRCKVTLDRIPPKVRPIVGQQIVTNKRNDPIGIEQGDLMEFLAGEDAFLIHYCMVQVDDHSISSSQIDCDPKDQVSTGKIELPKSGHWIVRYYGSDVAGNITAQKDIPIYVRQTMDIRRIKNDIISSGFTVDNDQASTLDSLKSMVDTYHTLETQIDKNEALEFINKHLVEISPKIREIASMTLDYEVVDLIGRPDSNLFAVKIRKNDVHTLILDRDLNVIKIFESDGKIDFIDKETWYFYDSKVKLLSLHKANGYLKNVSIPYEILPSKMAISGNLKYLASKTPARTLIVIDLENNRKIFETATTSTTIAFNLRFNANETFLYLQEDKSIQRFDLTNLQQKAVYTHKDDSIIIDLKIHTRRDNREVALLSIMYTKPEAKGSTGLFGLIWDSDQLDYSDLLDLNKNLINTNDEPYYGVLMEQNDDPHSSIVYFFNYYSKYTYEIDLNEEAFKVTRLEIPLPDPDIDNRIAAEKLKDKELLTLQSRIYLEQLRANAPYTYDPYPYVYGRQAILISEGERIVVLTDNKLEVRTVYSSLRPQLKSSFFNEIASNPNIESKIKTQDLYPKSLLNAASGYLALPQMIGSREFIYIYDEYLKNHSKIAIPKNSKLKGMSWTSDPSTIIIGLANDKNTFSIQKYDIKSAMFIGEIYDTKNTIERVYGHRSLKNSVLIVEKNRLNKWQVTELDIFGGKQLFERIESDGPIELYEIDADKFCIAAVSPSPFVRCYWENDSQFIESKLSKSLKKMQASQRNTETCLLKLCEKLTFEGTLDEFKSELSSNPIDISSDKGVVSLSQGNTATIFDSQKTSLLTLSNVESAGVINNNFWYSFSQIGYLTIGDFKSKAPIFDLKPGYITERKLWHIEYLPTLDQIKIFFLDKENNITVELFNLDKKEQLGQLERWLSSYKVRKLD